ncbi:NAD(P)/FAD-dependent oxidoreductase [uncultured Paraglaciecola sp.]|uniref:NAD(P)/FAD-dependent oxidoreductase n=1 Tax=uncultured Paraglaciecola sp. TaxID=1765024 RepID=UPI002632E8E8|nr:FAD-dependent oxidoreductase [uncultured Paraglaciecola sp.]
MDRIEKYQAIIVGGGLAGLSLAIQLTQEKRSVLLIEKGDYPRHKVCGEYISLESWNFVERLGIPLGEMNLPIIDSLKISAESGLQLESKLNFDLAAIICSFFVFVIMYCMAKPMVLIDRLSVKLSKKLNIYPINLKMQA